MQAVQDQLASNQSNYISGLERKQRLEDQNRDEVFNFNERQRRRVFDDEMRLLNRQKGIDPGNRIGDLEALAQFSKTVAEVTADIGKRQSEDAMWDEYSKTYEFGLPIDRLEAQEAGYQALAETDERIQTVADRMQANGAPPEAVMSLRKVSGSRAVGQARALAEMAAMHYGPWLEKQFSQDNRTQIELNGETFTPAEVANDPVKRAAATSVLWKNYLTGNNLVGLSPALLAPAFKQMKMAEQQQLAEARTAYAIAGSEQMLDEAKAAAIPAFKTNPGQAFTTLVQSYARSLDQRGQPLGFTAGRQKAMDYLRLAIDTNDVTLESLDAIEDFPTPHQPNRTWGQLYGPELRKLREEVENNYIEDSRRQDSVLQQDGKRWADGVLKEISDNPQSEETLKRLIKHSLDTFGFVDDRLQYYVNNYSTEKIEAERLNDEFEKLAQANRLTLDMVTDPRVPFTVRQQWQNIAKQQSDARAQTGDFKANYEAIDSRIEAAASVNRATGEPLHYTIPLAKAAARARFNNQFSTLLRSGMSPEEAASQALQLVITDIGDGKSGQFQYDLTGGKGFVRFGFSGYGDTRDSVQKAAERVDFVRAKVQGGGVASLDKYNLIPREVLLPIDKNRTSPNIQPPAIAQFISDLYGGKVSPFEVLNRQLVAQGFEALPTPEPLQKVESVISPELRRLLTYKPSPRRVNRVMLQSGVPPQYIRQGQEGAGDILQLMSSIGFEQPALAAAQWALESGWGKARSGKHNYFGIKGTGSTVSTSEFIDGKMTTVQASFRDYTSPVQSAQDYANLLKSSPRYRAVLQARTPREAAIAVAQAGYATDPQYANKLVRVMSSMGINPDVPYQPPSVAWRQPGSMRPKLVYRIDSIGPTSTGPHLDVKDTQGGMFGRYDLDNYIEVEVGGSRKPLSTVITDDQAAHRRRGSHGIDFAYPKGTPVFLKNGAQVISNSPTEHGDKLVIQLPDGRTFSFLHGRKV
jgi:hypothetical protein